MKPIRTQHNLADQSNRNDQENEAAPTSPTRKSSSKTKALLEPIEESI